MALKPSRRIPKAYQRKTSSLSRRIAQKSTRTRRKRTGVTVQWTKLTRHWRRCERSIRGLFTHIKFWCVCLIFGIIVSLVFFFLFSSYFEISSIRVSRQDRRVDVEEIQQKLAPYFGRHIFFVSPLLLHREVQSSYPEVSSVRVRRNFPGELHVTLFMDDIVAEVLVGEPGDTESSLLVSEESEEHIEVSGIHRYLTTRGIFLEYPFSLEPKEGEERMRLHLVDWAVKPTHREPILSEDAIHEVQAVQRILEESFGHHVSLITFYIRAKEFHVSTENRVLWFDFASSSIEQINRYREFLRALSPEQVEEYIDLRIHDRVVYR